MNQNMHSATGFGLLEGTRARLLILGSLPGEASIRAQQYYAHPRNSFWRLMQDIFGVSGDYEARTAGLIECDVALWDVLAAAERPGSLDAKIQMRSAKINDFAEFFERHPELSIVACNGAKAYTLFKRSVVIPEHVGVVKLPSTSPAHAAMTYPQKRDAWRVGLDDIVSSRAK